MKKILLFTFIAATLFILASCDIDSDADTDTATLQVWGPTSEATGTERATSSLIYSSGETYNFGSVNNGYRESTFSIKNTGTADLTISDFTLSGDTTYLSIEEEPVTTITPDCEATFKLKLQGLEGTSSSDRSGTLTFNSNDPNVATFTLSLTGLSS